LRIVHDELVRIERGLELASAFLERGFAGFAFRNVFDHQEEMLGRALLVPQDAGRAAHPKDFAVFVDVTFVACVARRPVQQALGKLPASFDVVGKSDVLGRALAQLLIGIADHLAKRGVDLKKALVECEHRHPNRGALKELAKDRVARGHLHGFVKVGSG